MLSADVDRGIYVTVLLEFLHLLHFAVEQWSRMDDVQEILVEHGAFYLLLNELHTASTAPVSTWQCKVIFIGGMSREIPCHIFLCKQCQSDLSVVVMVLEGKLLSKVCLN